MDTEELLLHAVVHPADVPERDGGILLLATLFGLYPFLKKLFADGGYQGPKFRTELARVLPGLAVEIVKRSDTAQGFEVLPRRFGSSNELSPGSNGVVDWQRISRTRP